METKTIKLIIKLPYETKEINVSVEEEYIGETIKNTIESLKVIRFKEYETIETKHEKIYTLIHEEMMVTIIAPKQ